MMVKMDNQKIENKDLNKSNGEFRIKLNPEFKKEIFQKLFKQYSSTKIAPVLNISRGMLYHYKNDRTKTIPLLIVLKIKELLDIPTEEIDKNTLAIQSSETIRNKGLDIGRKLRKKQLKDFKNNIPKVRGIIENNTLNLEKWFSCYQKLIDFGCRSFKNIAKERDVLRLEYTNYSNGKKKLFTTFLPAKIELNRDFQYFFGLWVGDKAGGGRIGIMNKEKMLNLYTAEYLRKLYQKVEFVLHVHKDAKIPKLDYNIDKVIRINSIRQGYAISVHAINSILKSFFEYLENDLDNFLNLIPNKNIFFAGLFDAEGNVFLEDKCFRWSCKSETNIPIFIKHLKDINLFNRFDGANLVTYNSKTFSKKILPYLKHPEKINDSNIICHGFGHLNERFKRILYVIKDNPGKTAFEIAKVLKIRKVFSQIKFLEDNKCIYRKNYPKRIYITNKGVASLSHGGKDKDDYSSPLLVAAASQ